MFYVEERNFLDDLKKGVYVQLNEEGIYKVLKIIENQNKRLEAIEDYIEKSPDTTLDMEIQIKSIIHGDLNEN